MCGISVVDLVASIPQTSLYTTWVEQPFPGVALAPFRERPSAAINIEDVDEAWNPLHGSTVFRAYAAPPRLAVPTVIDTQSSFESWGTMSAPVLSPPVEFKRISLLRHQGQLRACMVSGTGLPSGDGSRPPQTLSPFGDVKAVVGNIGRVFRVDCAVDGRQLHLVAVAENGGRHSVWHASRIPSGAWSAWEDVMAATTSPLVGVASAENIRDVAAGMCDNEGPAGPAGVPETRRLNIAWVENKSLTVVIRSRRAVTWSSQYPASRYSPHVTVGTPQGLRLSESEVRASSLRR